MAGGRFDYWEDEGPSTERATFTATSHAAAGPLDLDADGILGPGCPECGWRRGAHRPAAPVMGMPACSAVGVSPPPGT